MKYACGNAAKSHALQIIVRAHFKNIPIAVRQILFQFRCKIGLHNRTYNVNHFLRRKVICIRKHRQSCRLLVVAAVDHTEFLHPAGAFGAELYSCKCMNAVVDTCMHRYKTAQHLRIGCVDDRIHRQPGDVALPYRHAILNHRDIGKPDNTLFFRAALQVFVLNSQYAFRHLPRHTDVHKRAQDTALSLRVTGCLQIFILNRVCFEFFYQVIQTLILCHYLFHTQSPFRCAYLPGIVTYYVCQSGSGSLLSKKKHTHLLPKNQYRLRINI